MEAGPSLHQMQPAARPEPARIPGQAPNGTLRPPVLAGQRRGPVLTVQQAQAARTPIPPPMFQFQRVKKTPEAVPGAEKADGGPAARPEVPPPYMGTQPRPRTMTTPPSAPKPTTPVHRPRPPPPPRPHVPVSDLRRPPPRAPQHRTQQYYAQKSAYYAANPQTPSTSYSAPPVQDYTPKPTYTNADQQNYQQQMDVVDDEDLFMNSADDLDKLGEEDKQSTMIELPPNCKLFQYSCTGHDGVQRTLLVPMPMNATQEDVMKMLPDSFPEIAAKIFQSEQPATQEKVHTLSFPEGTSPSFEMMGGGGGANESPAATSSSSSQEAPPILVNPKQYRRIISRRQMRQKLEISGRLPLHRQKYLHESRHLHAINRKRGHDGRFDPKLRQNSAGGPSAGSSAPKYRTAVPPRQITTYAEIRPAHNDTTVASCSSETMTSSSVTATSSSSSNYYQPITNYQQYQQHVQYSTVPTHLQYPNNGSSGSTVVVHNDNGETQNFTNL